MIITNGRVCMPAYDEPVATTLRVDSGRITEIGANVSGDGEVLDAEGLLVMPGAIDPHVHFFDPGYEHKEEDFYSGSAGSASGGVTTVIDMPDTSEPAAIDGASTARKAAAIGTRSVIDFGLFGGISGALVDDQMERRIQEMAGDVCAIKTYAKSGSATFPRVSHYQYPKILALTAKHDVIVLVHAEDAEYIEEAEPIERAAGDGGMRFYQSRPEITETLSVFTVTEIAEQLAAQLHVVHLGTIRAAEIVAGRAYTSGETCPQYLAFDCEDFERIGAPLKITPPVKGPENKAVLWRMLVDGGIDFIASDHAPGTRAEKNTGSIWTDYAGIPGGPLVFHYVLSEGYLNGRMSLERLLAVTSGNAARRYRLADRKGSIEVGKDADLVFVDPEAETVFDPEACPSRGKVTPWEGYRLRGRIMRTILRGTTVFDARHGITAEPGTGAFLRPNR